MLRNLRFLSIILVMALVFAACGGGKEDADTEEAVKAPKEEEKAKELTPEEVGDKIGTLYVQAVRDVTELLMDKPPEEEVRSKVEELKESYVQKLVALGRKRVAFSSQDKAKVDLRIRSHVNKMGSEPWFATFNEVQQHYFSKPGFSLSDNEF